MSALGGDPRARCSAGFVMLFRSFPRLLACKQRTPWCSRYLAISRTACRIIPATYPQVAALEGELATSQREAGEAKQELQRQAAAHEAETSAAAARITGGCGGQGSRADELGYRTKLASQTMCQLFYTHACCCWLNAPPSLLPLCSRAQGRS